MKKEGVTACNSTPIYDAPELFFEEEERFQFAAVDIWALGLTFMELILGKTMT
jgi:serine/threonine protein kinase